MVRVGVVRVRGDESEGSDSQWWRVRVVRVGVVRVWGGESGDREGKGG